MPVTIDKPSKYFTAKTYTGTGATQSISGLEFSPDLVWIKQRSGVTWHNLYDVVRGTTKALASNDTGADDTRATGLTAFTSDGFTLGTDNNANGSSNTYVSWCWDANGAGVSNTNGSISSTVSANTTSGFSIVSYTGNGTVGATIGHSLGVTPKMIIVKNRTSVSDWMVWFTGFTSNQGLNLNNSGATFTSANTFISSVGSSTFAIGNSSLVNTNTNTYIAYCFAEVKGFSKFGSYTGNGSADGTFVYTGFSPAFVICKSSSGAFSWVIKDSKRPSYNPASNYLYAQSTNAEATDIAFDFLSNGFKTRATGSDTNGSGGTYIYMAFASNPFVTSGGIPVTAR
jgi:hypothetical protein